MCQNDVNLCDDVCDVSCNDQCNNVRGNDALANSESGIDCESQFIVPIFVNGIRCKGLRDTGAFVPVIVDEKLVPKQHVNYDKTIKCVGLFSGEHGKCIPTAKIKIRSPWFSVKSDIEVTAAVTKLPAGLFCILGNSFFQDQNIPDIIQVTKPLEINAGEPSMTTPGPDPETRGHPGHVAVNDECENTENCESVTKINTDSAQNTMTERQRDAKVGGAENQADDGGVPVSVNRPRPITNELISHCAETAVKQISGADGTTTTLEPPETGERATDEMIAIIETRRQQAIKSNDRNKRASDDSDDSGDSTDDATNDEVRKGQEVQTDDGRDLQQTLNDMAAIDLSENAKPDRERADVKSTSDKFRTEQRNCKTLQALWTRAKAGSKQYKIIDGLLYRQTEDENATRDYALVVPAVYCRQLLILAHDDKTGGHVGVKKTLHRLQGQYYWPKMRAEITKHVRCCAPPLANHLPASSP